MFAYGKGEFTPEHEKKMMVLKKMIKDKLKGDKWGICGFYYPRRLDGRWRAIGNVIINGKDFDYETVFKDNKLRIKKTPYVDYTEKILKKMGYSQERISNLQKRYIAYLKKAGYPQKYIDNLKKESKGK